MPKKMTLVARIAKNVKKDAISGCWVWTARKFRNGYGAFHYRDSGKEFNTTSHAISYRTFVGEVPEGLVLDHVCNNRACANPLHLVPVTTKENVLRSSSPSGINHRKTHCIHGHEFSPQNTRMTRDGHRKCRICAAEETRRAEAKRSPRFRSRVGGKCSMGI